MPPVLARLTSGSLTPEEYSRQYVESKVKQQQTPPSYVPHLILACLLFSSYIATIVTTIILLFDYGDKIGNALSLKPQIWTIVGLYALKTITQIITTYVSIGWTKPWLLLFDILQIREVYHFIHYLKFWSQYQGGTKIWKRPWYLPHPYLTSTMVDVPSLVIQASVIYQYFVYTPYDTTNAQIACMIFTGLHTIFEHIGVMYYLTVSPRVYTFISLQTLVSLALRIVTLAFLIDTIKGWIYLYWFGSYIFGLFIVVRNFQLKAKKEEEEKRRDDPLQITSLKWLYGHLMALQLSFGSVPWAPQHNVIEWWYGYIYGEMKLLVEYAVAVALLVLLYKAERNINFWFLFGFATAFIFIYPTILYFINMGVSRSLRRRSLYSTTKIITAWVYFGNAKQTKHLGQQPDGAIYNEQPAKPEFDRFATYGRSVSATTNQQPTTNFNRSGNPGLELPTKPQEQQQHQQHHDPYQANLIQEDNVEMQSIYTMH